MIHYFTVKNHKSINEPLKLSFIASGLNDPSEYKGTFPHRKKTLLKTVGVFGGNASGKSNLLSVLSCLKSYATPNNFVIQTPFGDTQNPLESTDFEIVYALGGGDKTPLMRYALSIVNTHVIHEKLEKWVSQKPTTIYERNFHEGNDIVEFNPFSKDKKAGRKILKDLSINETLLSRFEVSSSDVGQAADFFRNRLIILDHAKVEREGEALFLKYMNTEQKPFQRFAERMLAASDMGITGLFVKGGRIFLKHSEGPASLEISSESGGARTLLFLCPYLYECFRASCLLVIDGYGGYFHPEISSLVMRFFLDERVNKTQSQFLFSSHQTAILGLGLLRRDSTVFVYKEEDSTAIHRLKEFGVRTHDKVQKGYEGGKYGTSPSIDQKELWRLKK